MFLDVFFQFRHNFIIFPIDILFEILHILSIVCEQIVYDFLQLVDFLPQKIGLRMIEIGALQLMIILIQFFKFYDVVLFIFALEDLFKGGFILLIGGCKKFLIAMIEIIKGCLQLFNFFLVIFNYILLKGFKIPIQGLDFANVMILMGIFSIFINVLQFESKLFIFCFEEMIFLPQFLANCKNSLIIVLMILVLFGDAGGEGLGSGLKIDKTELACFLELKVHVRVFLSLNLYANIQVIGIALFQFKNIQLIMKRDEAVRTDGDIKKYLQKNKLRAMFSQFTKELVLKQPDDPISYLINYLQKRTKRQIICLHSYDDESRGRLANIVANKFNYKLIELNALFKNQHYHEVDNEEINKKVQGQLKNTQSVYKGIIVSGYPNNLVQLDSIQKCGILPDRYFILPSNKEKLMNAYSSQFQPKSIELVLSRNQLQLKELKDNLGECFEELPEDVDKASDQLISTLSIKAKKQIPYESLRVLMLHPPYLIPQTNQFLTKQYSLQSISVEKALQKLSQKKHFNQFVEKHIRRNGYLSKEIQLAMLETECKSAASRNKGYIINGWPCRKQSTLFLKENFLNPHIILIMDMDDKSAQQKFSQLDERNHNLFAVSQKPSKEDYKRQLEEYRKVVEDLKKKQISQVLKWDDSEKQVQKAFEGLVDNPKIYS